MRRPDFSRNTMNKNPKKKQKPRNQKDLVELKARIRELNKKQATAKKRIASLTQDSFHLYTLMERLPDSIYFKDTESHFVRVNQAWAKKHKIGTPSETIGKTDFDYFPREFAQKTKTDELEIMRSGTIKFAIEKYEIEHDTLWFSSVKAPVKDLNNTVIGTCGITRDITVVKKAEEMLEQANTILEKRVQEKTASLLQANQQLEERIRQLDFLNEVSFTLSHKISVDNTAAAVVQAYCDFFTNAKGALYRYENEQWRLQYISGSMEKRFENLLLAALMEHGKEAFNDVLLTAIDDDLQAPRSGTGAANPEPRTLFVPLLADDKKVGILVLLLDQSNIDLYEKEKVFVRTLGSISGVSLEKSLQQAAARGKARFEGELLAARNIQNQLIPAKQAVFPQAEIYCHYRPANEVSGDYLDYFINDLGHLVIAIGDVCGKGVPAAMLMNVIRTTLRIYARRESSAHKLLRDVNEYMCDKLYCTSFISALCCIINFDEMSMSYARAGHPALVQLYGNGENPERHMTRGTALGLLRETNAFSLHLEEKVFPLKTGDRFFVYTDGITEAQLTDGSMFGDKQLDALLQSLGPANPEAIIHGVISAISDATMTHDIYDDETVLCFEIQ